MIRAMLTTVAAFALLLAASPASAGEAGTIVTMEGTVEIGRGAGWTPAAVGTAVQTGDTVRTRTPGRARILFIDDSVLNVADGSTIVIDETIFDANKGTATTLLRLLGGKVRALVSDYYKGTQTSYRIETTTAVSGVRGTEFIVAFDAQTQLSEVLGLGGSIGVHSTMDRKNHGVVVRSNEITEVAKGKYPTPPRQISSDDPRYQRLMAGLKLPGGGGPETLLQNEPAFGEGDLPEPDTAGGIAKWPSTGETGELAPLADLPPSEPGETGGDVIGQPQPVLEGPTDVEVPF